MVADGLVVGTSGNLSARAGDLVAVSPSGVPYEDVTPELVGVYGLDGGMVEATLPPTSELALHLACYARDDVDAVVHTHSVAATAVSALPLHEVPAVHYQVATFGGPVRIALYQTYGTPELARSASHAISGRTGCLLANHGAVTVGRSLDEAYSRARYLEWLCDVYLRAASSGATVNQLDRREIGRVVEKFKNYGPFRGASSGPR
jgi:L-fuculose-phosphate aldolase